MVFRNMLKRFGTGARGGGGSGRTLVEKWRLRMARRRCDRFPLRKNTSAHGLAGELIVSLTSYPPRFPVLHQTIKSLLDQSVAFDRLILWIAHDDLSLLPVAVQALESRQFTIRTCDDLGSYKKILPTLTEYPRAFIVTADDDTYYPPNWLAGLVRHFDPGNPSLVCHRAHRLRHRIDGTLASYLEWDREVSDRQSRDPRSDLFPTGVGGVLYPPGSLPAEALDWRLIERLCPTCDDSWLFFMTRSGGWKTRRAPGDLRLLTWPRSQKEALRKSNRGGRKDEMLQLLSQHFGTPH